MKTGVKIMKMLFSLSLVVSTTLLFGRLSVPIENNGDVNITDITPNVAVQGEGTKITVKGEGFNKSSFVYIEPPVTDTSKILSNIQLDAQSLIVKNNLAYTAGEKFNIIDIENKNDFKVISSIDTYTKDSKWLRFDIKENIAYIADKEAGLTLIDISNTAEPKIISNINLDGKIAYNISVNENIAYISLRSEGLMLVDITDISNLKVIKHIDSLYTGEAYDLGVRYAKVDKNYLYVLDYYNLRIFEITDPLNIKEISSTNISEWGWYLEIYNNYAFITGGGLTIVDLSNLESPKLLSKTSLSNGGITLDIKKDKVYIADDTAHIGVVDISDYSNPSLLYYINSKGSVTDIKVNDNVAYVSNEYYGLTAVDITSEASNNGVYSKLYKGKESELFLIKDNYVIASGDDILLTDYSDIYNPEVIFKVDNLSRIWDSKLYDNLLYVVDDYNTFSILNFNDIKSPKLLSSLDLEIPISSLDIVDSHAFVCGKNSLISIDLSDLNDTKIVSKLPMDYNECKIIVDKNTAYIAHDASSGIISIIDIEDPLNMKVLSTIQLDSWIFDLIEVKDNTLYISANGIYQVDVSDILNPKLINSVTKDNILFLVRTVNLVDNIAYASSDGTLTIVDLSNSNNPKILTNIQFDGRTSSSILLNNGKDILVSYDGGIKAIPNPYYYDTNTQYINENQLDIIFPNFDLIGQYNLRVTNDNDNYSKAHGVITLISPTEKQTLVPKDLTIRTITGDNGIINIDLNDTQAIKLNALLEYSDGSVTNIFTELNTTEYTVSTSDRSKAYYFNNQLIFNEQGKVTITVSAKGLSDSLTFNITDSLDPTIFKDSFKDAIIILGHLDDKGGELSIDNPYDPLRYSINKIGNNIYKTLSKFGIDKDNIHYFNPNGEQKLVDEDNDKLKDNAVDYIDFNWDDVLNTLNSLDSNSTDPLILWMVDHGLKEEIKISANKSVTATQIKSALDNFQAKTGRAVIAIFDACYSGSIAQTIQGNNRMVISSADSSSVTYMDPYGKSFSYYLLKYLRYGNSVKDSYDKASNYYNKQLAYVGLSTTPTYSNINTGLAKKLSKTLYSVTSFDDNYTISDFDIGNGEPNFIDYTGKDENITLISNSYDLEVKTDIPYLSLAKVYASITPPNPLVDVNSSKLIKSELVSLILDTNDNYFKNTYNFNEDGNYLVSYLIEDDDGNLYTSDSVNINKPQSDTSKSDTNTTVSISQGWNLISLPVDTTITYSDIQTKLPNAQTVWKYDNGWKAYGKGNTQDTLDSANITKLTSIIKEQGFWVNSSSSNTLVVSGGSYDITTSSSLTSASSGWHLLGTGTDTTTTAISNANSNINTIWVYENVWKAYSPNTDTMNVLKATNIAELENINQGQGFWINIQ